MTTITLYGVSGYAATWNNSDGTTKVITHNMGTKDIAFQLINTSSNLIALDLTFLTSVTVAANTVTFVKNVLNTNNYRVILFALTDS